MEKAGFLEIVLPKKESRYPRNLFPYDLEIAKIPVYEVKINSDNLNKFLQNPDIEIHLKKKALPLIYDPENIVMQYGKLSIVKNTENTVLLCYEGLNPSKPISKRAAWFKVFCKFIENKRLEKQDIMAKWNTADKNKFGSTKKTRDGSSYITKVRQQILDGLLRASLEIAKHVKIEKGKGSYRNSYNLTVD